MPGIRAFTFFALMSLALAGCADDFGSDYIDRPVDAVYPTRYATVLYVRTIDREDATTLDWLVGDAEGLQYTLLMPDGSTLVVEQLKTRVDDLIHPFDRVAIQQTRDTHFHVLPTLQPGR